MTEEIQYPDTPFLLCESLILLGRRGSEAHGTYIPSSDPNSIDDRDLMGVCIPPVDYVMGLKEWQHAEAIKGCWDVVLYDFRKFVRLLSKQNPNVLGLLWLNEEDYLVRRGPGRALIANRDLFKHRQAAYDAFCGYAISQLKKMKGGAFAGYMGEKRKKLVEKHGYDTKNAAHMVRLLHMGEEYLVTGQLNVRRTWDVEMLKEIKAGGWTLTRVQDYGLSKLETMRLARDISVLPEKLDEDAINDLVVVQMERWFA